MAQNVGTLDRAGRAVLAGVLLASALNKPGKTTALGAFTGGMLASSVISGYCPLYKIAGINTVGKPF